MEQAVILHITLSDDKFGSAEDRRAIAILEENIYAEFEKANFGELDGEEFGEGECVIYIYGANADKLYSLVEPLLLADSGAYRGYVVKRYGEPDDPNAREVQMAW